MNTFISKEIRWFITAEKAIDIEKWFRSMGVSRSFAYDATFSRSDFYLIMPGTKDIGIKIRDLQSDQNGKWATAFEVKKRTSENTPADFNGNEGRINCWEKLSYPLREGGSHFMTLIPENINTDNNWLEVGKERMLVKYDVDQGAFNDEDTRPDEGCGVELTKLVVRSGMYFSFGLEAFSMSGNHLDRNFQDCAEKLFQSSFINGLNASDSNSYPEWMNDVVLPGKL